VDNPTEQAHYDAGVRAVAKVMNRHVAGLVRARREFTLEGTVLLTASASQARDVPREVSDQIERLHRDIRDNGPRRASPACG
jgi:hypothetical protein